MIARNGLYRERARRPTLEEVAARAGVSRSTVSRVINGEHVSAESRQVVMHAVRELGYVPNLAARSLVTRRTGTIALAVPDAPGGDPWFSTVIRSAVRELEEAGKQVALMLAGSSAGRRRVEQVAAAGHVDGVLLVCVADADPLPAALARTAAPVVLLGKPAGAAGLPYVEIDNLGGAAAAVRHLLERGRRRIATIGGPTDTAAGRERLAGYREAMREAGSPATVALGDLTPASGAEAMRRLLAEHPGLDAVFAAGDSMAIGALAALREAGRRVPDDVAVVGFDDVDAAAYTVPPLTTVHVPAAEQGAAAARLLLDRLGGARIDPRLLPARLIVRASA
nr:LacI family DNA-binding transcriptional regulator [Thermostaphylospora chromogena]